MLNTSSGSNNFCVHRLHWQGKYLFLFVFQDIHPCHLFPSPFPLSPSADFDPLWVPSDVSVVQFQCIAQVQDVEKEMDGNDDARNATFERRKVPEKKTETLKEKMTKTRGPEKILRTESLGT